MARPTLTHIDIGKVRHAPAQIGNEEAFERPCVGAGAFGAVFCGLVFVIGCLATLLKDGVS